MPWPDDLVTLIEAAGIASASTDIFVGPRASIPDLPGGAISIMSTSGGAPERTHNSVSRPSMINVAAQIKVRAKRYVVVDEKIRRVYNATANVRNTVINGGFYREITALQEPHDQPLDDRGLVVKVFNVTATKRAEEVV